MACGYFRRCVASSSLGRVGIALRLIDVKAPSLLWTLHIRYRRVDTVGLSDHDVLQYLQQQRVLALSWICQSLGGLVIVQLW